MATETFASHNALQHVHVQSRARPSQPAQLGGVQRDTKTLYQAVPQPVSQGALPAGLAQVDAAATGPKPIRWSYVNQALRKEDPQAIDDLVHECVAFSSDLSLVVQPMRSQVPTVVLDSHGYFSIML
jgi:hypothetical protein